MLLINCWFWSLISSLHRSYFSSTSFVTLNSVNPFSNSKFFNRNNFISSYITSISSWSTMFSLSRFLIFEAFSRWELSRLYLVVVNEVDLLFSSSFFSYKSAIVFSYAVINDAFVVSLALMNSVSRRKFSSLSSVIRRRSSSLSSSTVLLWFSVNLQQLSLSFSTSYYFSWSISFN